MLFSALLFALRLTPGAPDVPLKQPQIAAKGSTVVLTYGAGNAVYFARSDNAGKTFAPSVKVAEAKYLALGNHRGPRIAFSGDTLVITAIVGETRFKDGDLLSWRSTDAGKTWSKALAVSDVPAAAREGLHGMANGPGGEVWVVWLDLRTPGMKLYGALSKDAGATWGANRQIYASPDGHICECCHPTAHVGPKGELYAMWRNWIGGSRDMHYAVSKDGTSWTTHKLGEGTWPLNACPMDGGGLVTDAKGVHSAWRRDGIVYVTTAGGPESVLGKGKNPAIAMAASGVYVVWQDGMTIYLKKPGQSAPAVVGQGTFPILATTGNRVYAAWEHHGELSVEPLQ